MARGKINESHRMPKAVAYVDLNARNRFEDHVLKLQFKLSWIGWNSNRGPERGLSSKNMNGQITHSKQTRKHSPEVAKRLFSRMRSDGHSALMLRCQLSF